MENVAHLHHALLANDIKGLIFDLDGTLIDSAKDILQALRLSFAQAGIGDLPDDYIPSDLHGTGEGIMKSVIEDMGWTGPSDFKAFRKVFIDNYTHLQPRQTHLYPAVIDFLTAAKRSGLIMGVCTNNTQASAKITTQRFGLDSFFSFTTGADTWSVAKPSPVPLIETIRMLDLQPEECVYFGDTSVDAEAALGAGVRFALHTTGYGDKALKGKPTFLAFKHWQDLLTKT